jgi:hypothetical protein
MQSRATAVPSTPMHAAGAALGAAHTECLRAAAEVVEVAGVISTLIDDHQMIRGSSHPQ